MLKLGVERERTWDRKESIDHKTYAYYISYHSRERDLGLDPLRDFPFTEILVPEVNFGTLPALAFVFTCYPAITKYTIILLVMYLLNIICRPHTGVKDSGTRVAEKTPFGVRALVQHDNESEVVLDGIRHLRACRLVCFC